MIHDFALRRDCTCSVKHSLGHILNLQPSYSSEPHAEISYDCNAIDFDWTHMMRSWDRSLMPCYLNVLSQKKSVDLTSVDHFSIISVVVPTPLYILIAIFGGWCLRWLESSTELSRCTCGFSLACLFCHSFLRRTRLIQALGLSSPTWNHRMSHWKCLEKS